jgi:hypothetical protein
MSYSIEIEQIDLDEILSGNIKVNTNNHWIDGKKPDDYDQVNKLTETHNWINIFKNFYAVFNIDYNDIKCLKSAYNIFTIKNSVGKLFEEEIQLLTEKYSFINKYLELNGGHFIRCENVSLKYGKNGCVPYKNLLEVFESIITTPSTHTPLVYDIDKKDNIPNNNFIKKDSLDSTNKSEGFITTNPNINE